MLQNRRNGNPEITAVIESNNKRRTIIFLLLENKLCQHLPPMFLSLGWQLIYMSLLWQFC